MKTVLTIAGFDPSSGAGVTADLMVFAAHGLFGTSCITALTVQSTMGVVSTHPVDADVLAATLTCLQADLPSVGIKIGMIGNGSNIFVINEYLQLIHQLHADSIDRPTIVLDPILKSSSGRELVDAAGLKAMRDQLVPLSDWVTPNVDELAWLSGRPVTNKGELRDAARAFQDATGKGSEARLGVFAKGGHLDMPDDLLLTRDGKEVWLPGERIQSNATHGTGCALSSAFLSRLVLGDSAEDAATGAKDYVANAIRTAVPMGQGHGPMNLLWPLRGRGAKDL